MSDGIRAPEDWRSQSLQSITVSKSPPHPIPGHSPAFPNMGENGGTSPGSSWETKAVDIATTQVLVSQGAWAQPMVRV